MILATIISIQLKMFASYVTISNVNVRIKFHMENIKKKRLYANFNVQNCKIDSYYIQNVHIFKKKKNYLNVKYVC